MKARRVVISGMGVVSPLGCQVNTLFDNLIAGRNNFSHPANMKKNYIGNTGLISCVSDDYEERCGEYGLSRERSVGNYINVACMQSITEASLSEEHLAKSDLYIGLSVNHYIEKVTLADKTSFLLKGPFDSEITANLASVLKIGGEITFFPVACTGGNVAISVGTKKIKYGRKDICIVGGADLFCDSIYSVFYSLNAISRSIPKPFDKERDGIVVGEGAAFVVLEELEHAQKRGAHIFAEISGYDICCDAYNITSPDPEGKMAAISIRNALTMAGKKPSEVSYISPHGTGTRANDLQEARAIFHVFGEQSHIKPISAIKSMLGHCMAAASAIEAIVSVVSMHRRIIPRTINFNQSDDEFPCTLNMNNYDTEDISVILSNSFAFGGNICCVIFSRFE